MRCRSPISVELDLAVAISSDLVPLRILARNDVSTYLPDVASCGMVCGVVVVVVVVCVGVYLRVSMF